MLLGPWFLFLSVAACVPITVVAQGVEEMNYSKATRGGLVLPRCCPIGTYGYVDCAKFLNAKNDPYHTWKTYYSPLLCSMSFEFNEGNIKLEENSDLIVDGIQMNKTAYCLDLNEANKLKGFYCINKVEESISIPLLVRKISTIISIVLLLTTAGVYGALPRLRKSSQSPYIICLTLALATAFIVLIRIQLFPATNKTECVIIGYSLQYFFLAAFFWMNAKCINFYKKISEMRLTHGKLIEELNKKEFRHLSIYAWGVPLLISIITYCCQHYNFIPDTNWKPDIGVQKCFFSNWSVKWIYFYGPLAVILVADFVLFALTVRAIVKNKLPTKYRIANATKRPIDVWYLYQYMKLFLVTGLSWTVEVIEAARQSNSDSQRSYWEKKWLIPDTINCLHGAFIFIFFVCERGVIRQILFSQMKNNGFSFNCLTLKSSQKVNHSNKPNETIMRGLVRYTKSSEVE